MKTKYNIYIPSKGRANDCATAELLEKENVLFKIVIEPQDFNSYLDKYDQSKLFVLDKNNMGLSYARNFIKNHCKLNSEAFSWQLDDDIKYIQRRIDSKNVNCSAHDLFCEVEKKVDKYNNIGVAGLRDSFFAWTQTSKVSINKLVSSAFLVNNNNDISWSYDMIEDIDYCLQVLIEGQCTLIFNDLLYKKKPNNKAAGGLQSFGYERLQRNLVNKYPTALKLRHDEKSNSYKIAPSRVWSTFNQILVEI